MLLMGMLVFLGILGICIMPKQEMPQFTIRPVAYTHLIELVHRSRGHEGNIGAMLVMEEEGMFHITLIAVGRELDSINIITMNMFLILPAGTNLLQSPKSTMEDVVLAFIPVSYTHLDVYKRQAFCEISPLWISISLPPIS